MRIIIPMILLFSVLLSNLPFVATAQEQNITTPTPTQESTKSAQFVNYDLAFPGMLPDHPLYKIKVLKNKITARFISDPEKKIEFYLRETDKGILASAILVDKRKIDLAGETAMKAEHNFTLLVTEVYKSRKKIDKKLVSKLEKAALKHQEVLQSLIKRVAKDEQKDFQAVLGFSKTNIDELHKALKQKERKR